jgi:hypothetical protein
MLFIEWWPVARNCIGLLLIVISVLAFRWALRKNVWLRVPVQFVSGLVLICSLAFWSFYWLMPNPWTYSAPIYSPNHRMAARVAEYNASGFGGADSSVELFGYGGLFSKVVFFGEFGSVGASDIRWKSDSELEISFHGDSCRCNDARRVRVRCERQDGR